MDNRPLPELDPELGASLGRRFAATYAVTMLARKADYMTALACETRQRGALCPISVAISAIAGK